MKLNNKKGIAVITSLLFVVILYGLAAIFLLETVQEGKMAGKEREYTKAFYAAQGAGQEALKQLDTLINTYLLTTISSANPSGVISFATSQVAAGNGVGWLVYAARNNNVPVLEQDGEEALYPPDPPGAVTGTIGGVNYQYNIVMTEKSDPVATGVDTWEFPYSYRIEATGMSGSTTSNVSYSGDFTVELERDNFAKFALFTNNQTTQSGVNVWFTDRTNFAGPVHTNNRFNFALNPSGTFEEEIRQTQQTARFYNKGAPVLLDAAFNGTRDVPVFHDTFTRGAPQITLSSPTQEADMEDQADAGQTITTDGIYVPNNGGALTGGIYIRGDGNVALSVDGSNNPVYTITQGSTAKTITINQSTQQTTVYDSSTSSSTTYSGFPDGVDNAGTLIYSSGNINSFSGTVQSNSQLTIGSSNNIIITNHVRYQSYTPAVGAPGQVGYVPPSAAGTTNLLGIVSWNGNVRIGTSAPNNVDVHGTVLASNGVFQVDDYTNTSVGPRGTATLLGGVISDDYGAFGQFNGSTGLAISGYGRNFVYDQRMEQGLAPPYFPSLNTFIAFTNDITDKIVWQEGE